MENLPQAIRISAHHRARLLAIVVEIQKSSGLEVTPTQLMESLIKSKEADIQLASVDLLA